MATAADQLIAKLQDWGVDVVFGLPGDGINGIMEALRLKRDEIRFIQVRHEEAAAYMACAYAKYTGRLGCCLATSGPGAIHLLNGLYDAKLDGAPVIALTGMTYHDLIGTFYQQDVNTEALFENVTVYNNRIMGPAHVAAVTDLACRMALSQRGVAHITFPVDLQLEPAGEGRSERNIPGHTAAPYAPERPVPTAVDLERAAQILNKGKRVVILAGRGALDACDELEQAAELLGAPIVKALMGKGAVPDTSPYSIGGLGLLGTAPSEDAMDECDTILMVGTSFPYMEFLPTPGQVRGVQIDVDPGRIGLRFPVDVGLVGDSRRTLQLLLPQLARQEDRSFLAKAQERMHDWWRLMEVQGTRQDTPIKPQVPAWLLNDLLPPDAIISTDSGTVTTFIARHFKIHRGQQFALSGNLASIGCGLPYAIAAAVAYPDRRSIAFVGDGGFTQMMGELATAVKYNLPLVVVVLKNNTLGMIRWEQIAFLGNPEYGCELQPIEFAQFARACGGYGVFVDDPTQLRDALASALSAGRPALVEVLVDANEPPMPAKISRDQALHFAQALLRGQPEGKRIALTLFRDRIVEIQRT